MATTIRAPHDVPDGTPMAVSLRSTRELTTGSWRTFKPVYLTRPSPCNMDCPAGTDVRAFLTLAAHGDAVGAWRKILERNPLPGVCGRVCYHPCETGCNRVALDGGVAVHAIERAIADEARRTAESDAADTPPPDGAGVAIVGSGPAGLSCAYHIARRGHAATVFDGEQEPGGMLRYGIPAYRLPRHVLDREIDLLRRAGVEFKMDARLGASLSWSELRAYDAVFVAVGLQRSKRTPIRGEHLGGVRPAIEFLREVNAGGSARVSGRVVIVGGGNTAIDAARVALRQGATATVVYRRSRAEMPAHPDEIAQAEIEGVEFVFLAAPIEFHGWRRVLTSVQCQRMRLGRPDASGRRAPEPIPDATFTLACNHALMAIGEELEQATFESAMEMADGRLKADEWGRTANAPLFAGGDAATGAGTVVDAISSGRRAAEAIDSWLEDGDVECDPLDQDRVRVADLNLFYFGYAPRATLPMRYRSDEISGFREVAAGLSWQQAAAEARRCLSCGLCNDCGNCVTFCPDAAVSRQPSGLYVIDEAHCKGCGVCVAECPRGAMMLVPEAR